VENRSYSPQQHLEKMLALGDSRAAMYAGEMEEGRVFEVPDRSVDTW
jgi:hypothetical protein